MNQMPRALVVHALCVLSNDKHDRLTCFGLQTDRSLKFLNLFKVLRSFHSCNERDQLILSYLTLGSI